MKKVCQSITEKLVIVRWDDASMAEGWQNAGVGIETAIEEAVAGARILTVGFLVQETETHIAVCINAGGLGEGPYADVQVIPRNMILRLIHLKDYCQVSKAVKQALEIDEEREYARENS